MPIHQFVNSKQDESLESVRKEISEELDRIYDTVFEQALDSQLLRDLIAKRLPLYPAPSRVLADSPDKLVNEINPTHMRLATELQGVIMGAQSEAIFISPYYVPGESGVQMVRDLTAKGVRVIILTNSLASTNHVPVHSAYARYRKAVIQAGAELYEARANAARDMIEDRDGPDTLTLHTKAFIIDERKLFVGSLNLDPRSIELNAEMGLLIDFADMIADMTTDLKHGLATLTYRVQVNDRGKLEWHARIDDRDVIETKEPLTGWWRRFKAWCMKIAPESQL